MAALLPNCDQDKLEGGNGLSCARRSESDGGDPWKGLISAVDESADLNDVCETGPSQNEVEFQSLCCPSMLAIRNERSDHLLVPLVKTPESALRNIMALAKVSSEDIFLDLGCGDGRIVTGAAQHCGALSVGFDFNDTLLRLCRRRANELFLSAEPESASKLDLRQRVRFLKRNFLRMGNDPVFLASTVIFMYLLPPVLEELEPLLFEAKEKRPSLRLVTFMNHFDGHEATEEDLFGVLRLYSSSALRSEKRD